VCGSEEIAPKRLFSIHGEGNDRLRRGLRCRRPRELISSSKKFYVQGTTKTKEAKWTIQKTHGRFSSHCAIGLHADLVLCV
jgi:hypothetical protein